MVLQIDYTAAAIRDLRDLTLYGAMEFGNAASEHYSNAILAAVKTLAQFPFAGTAVTGSEDRSFIVRNHRIIYRSNAATLSVIRILHTRQLPPGLD